MSFSGVRFLRRRSLLLERRRFSASSSTPAPAPFSSVTALVLAILLLSQMCVRCHCSRAASAAVSAATSWPSPVSDTRPSPPSMIPPAARARLLQKYFRRGVAGVGEHKFTAGDQVFDESKRKIPSCPDPLHN